MVGHSKPHAVRGISILVVFAMVVSLIGGCSAQQTKDTASEAGSTGSAASEPAGYSLPIVKDPLTLSIFIQSRQPDKLITNDTLSFKELEKRTNIKFDITTVAGSESATKFPIMMSSGQIPDIVCYTLPDLNKYGIEGAFANLDSYISQYAPNLQQYLVQDKLVHAETAAPDGKIYAVPMLSAIRTAMGYCIRQDWLDKLGLKAPVTIDDWYNVLKAFKTKDPNGNGKADEVPLILDKAWENYYMNFLDAWGIEADPAKDYWNIRDGKVTFSAIQPEFKEFLTTMSKWYQEGLIDQEFATREDTNNFHILNNIGGSTCYWTGYIASQSKNPDVLKNDPKTNWQVIAPPVLKSGDTPKTFSQQDAVVWQHAWAVSASCKDIPDAVKLFDYVYSKDGSLLFNFGTQGNSYNVGSDGKPHYTDTVKNYAKGPTIWIRENGLQAFLGMRQMKEYEEDNCGSDNERTQLFNYIDKNYFTDPQPTLNLTEEENTQYQEKYTAIKTYVEEHIMKFMTGKEPISNWDTYVNQVKSLGIDDLQKLKTNAYERYLELAK